MSYIFLCILGFLCIYMYISFERKRAELGLEITLLERKLKTQKESEPKLVQNALDKSRSVMRGQATEHLIPHIATEWNPKDYRFVGNPIDYIICDGLSDIHDGIAKDINEIVLLEVKSGRAGMNKVQRRIKDAVESGRVCFVLINPETKEFKKYKYKEKQDAIQQLEQE